MQERLVSYMFYICILDYISTKLNVKKDSIVQKYKTVLQ